MQEEFETIIRMIFGDECEFVTDSIAITDIDKHKRRYHVVLNNDQTPIDEWVSYTGIIQDKNGIQGYVFRLKEFMFKDALDDFFGIEHEDKAVILSIGGKTYTNCDELQDKYILDKTIRWENKLQWRDKEYTVSIENDKYGICKMIEIKRKET